MLKIESLKICEMAWRGNCKNGFFIKKLCSKSDKCKDCQITHRREMHNKQRKERLLLMKQKNNKKKGENLKRKYGRAVKKVRISDL